MTIVRYFIAAIIAVVLVAVGFTSCMRGGKLSQITVTPTNAIIAPGTTYQFIATATFASGETFTSWSRTVVWTTSDPTAVSISNADGSSTASSGLATSLLTNATNTGAFVITATDTANNISGTAILNVVTPLGIQIAPINPITAVNTTLQLGVGAILSSDTPPLTQDLSPYVTWTTSNPTIATISSSGVLSTLATGTTDIIPSIPSGPGTVLSGLTTLTVTNTPVNSITVSPVAQVISLGTATQLQFNATGNYTDATTQNFTSSSAWQSSDTSVATISNTAGSNGLATAVSAGTVTITATDPVTSTSGQTTLTVAP